MDVLIPNVAMKCDCEARRHKLVQNCVNCGKIICEQEGRGPCNFCGIPLGPVPLSSKQVKEKLDKRDTDDFEKARLEDLHKALAQRDRLLMYEATKAKRTTVIDDQVDYFESTSNQWLSVEERESLAEAESAVFEAREESRTKGGAYKVELDLEQGLATAVEKPKPILSPGELQALKEEAMKKGGHPDLDPESQGHQGDTGAEGVDEYPALEPDGDRGEAMPNPNVYVSSAYRSVLLGDTAGPEEEYAASSEDDEFEVKNPRILPHPQLQQAIPYTPSLSEGEGAARTKKKRQPVETEKELVVRKAKSLKGVQNDYFEEDQEVYKNTKPAGAKANPWVYVNSPIVQTWKPSPDRGMCMSMHQPWASLLAYGIKRHEGRSWATEHRGRLWIHAAAHEPSQADIRMVENFYRGLGATRFPTHYPQSVLLGCVTVEDCLHTDDYKVLVSEEKQESQSEYVFMCGQAQLLVVPLRMEGKHKIYQLDKKIWNAAQKQAGG